jgi:hypothetical protein
VRFIGIFLVSVLVGPALAGPVDVAKFPGTNDSLLSPSKHFRLFDEDHDAPPYHSLLLQDQGNGKRTKILDFSRNIDVAWAPNSESFFINDHAESNSSDCILVFVNNLSKLSALAVIRNSEKISLKLDQGHLYITCVSWMDGSNVVVLLDGYDGSNPGEVEKEILMDVNKRSVTAIH